MYIYIYRKDWEQTSLAIGARECKKKEQTINYTLYTLTFPLVCVDLDSSNRFFLFWFVTKLFTCSPILLNKSHVKKIHSI